MKKILDILIIVLLTILVVNLFSDNNEKNLTWNVLIEASDSSYTIPASVWLNIKNNSAETVKINTCENIKVSFAWSDVKFNDDFCKDIEVVSWNSYSIDYNKYYDLFTETWKYQFNISLGDKNYIDQFEIENRGSITKLFIALFYAPAYNLLAYLITLFSWAFGWAIVMITVIIRLILLYPQHKMMVSQRKLQAIQPKIKEIQKQFKWNQQMLGMKLMELYKKEKVNPMWSCGFLLIQMPILIVLYHIILSIKDPANTFHLYGFLASFDLSIVTYDFFGLDLLKAWGIEWAILAIIVAVLQFFQIKLSLDFKKSDNKWIVLEKKKWDDKYSQFMPDPEMMNKFMLYGMPAMVLVFTYTLFAWVGIYWWISTLFMLVQQIFVNKILKK